MATTCVAAPLSDGPGRAIAERYRFEDGLKLQIFHDMYDGIVTPR